MPGLSGVTRQVLMSLSFDVDGDTLTVTFDRNRITPAWFAASKAYIDDQDPLTTPRALAAVIVSWDVTQDDGTPFAPTPENLAVLPLPMLNSLMNEILDAAVPSRAEGNASSVPSSIPPSVSEAPPLTPPNGAVISPSPAPSTSPLLT